MRLIDGNKIIMSLADWWYSSFRQEETKESKAIKKVMDQVEKMVMEMPEIVRCEDCISRQDTLNALCAKCGDAYRNCRDYKAWCPNVKVVMSMPPVEPKRLPQPHKCVVYRDGECRYPIEACSECPKHEGMRAVLAERPKGEWIVYPLADNERVELGCHECGDIFIRAIGYRPHFCENCGCDCGGEE